ncbi:SDR family NAD(P)-dependent oxidoreductase [Streptomyces sp. NPDC059909]|uniref:SDR family NAD(P)-dependent oxidoreductase n=1 Tax=Streptomyces sp. NPDC059909 TaxID=3346998 RepID=UPI0036698AB0
MLLDGKVAMIFGAGGAVGGAVARRFAAEGAVVHLSGRTVAGVEAVAEDINAAGGVAYAARVDASVEAEVADHVADVAQRSGGIDVVLNAVGVDAVQGVALLDLPVADVLAPVSAWTSSQLITSVAAARHMVRRGRGTVITLSASTARLAVAGTGGFGVACAAVEALSRTLAAELGAQGVRVVCLRSHRIDDTLDAHDLPMPLDDFRGFLKDMTVLKRLPTLAEVAGAAAFVASDDAAAMSATVLNLTAGANVD